MAGMAPDRPLPTPPQPAQPQQSEDPRQRDTVADDEDEGGGPASPEEQAAYDQFVNAGYRLIYAGGKVNDNILKLLDDDPQDLIAIVGAEAVGKNFNPVMALAATTAVICLEIVDRSAEKPAGEIILHGGTEILQDLAELAGTANIHNFTEDEINDALIAAVNIYRMTASAKGMVDNEALSEEFAELLNAQDQGKLGKMLPGIEKFA